MSIADIDRQIADLEAQKRKLIEDEKRTALKKVELAIQELNALGFNYSLTQETTTRKRRSGVRDDVLSAVQNGSGLKPTEIAEALGLDNKRGKQSVANALSALKKAEKVTVTDGKYHAS